MSFLSDLGSIVNDQFGFGENSVTSQDSIGKNGRVENFGTLGKFAQKFDQSAQRSYIEDGFVRNVRPRLFDVLWQAPDVTVVIKKRMFSSLSENFRTDLLEADEKLFLRASKRLFQNKCRAIAAYERLSKIERIARQEGAINSYMFPMLMSGISELENIPFLSGLLDSNTKAAFDTLQKVHAFGTPSQFTNWSVASDTPFTSEFGDGTGTFELTLVSSVQTKSSVKFNNGNANLTIEDPYKLMIVTNNDIDSAITDASNYFQNSSFSIFTTNETRKIIEDEKNQLNDIRRARGASPIHFVISQQTLGKKVRAIVEAAGLEINFEYNPGIVGIGSGVSVDSSDLNPSPRLGIHGLANDEESIFGRIISNTFLLLAFNDSTKSEVYVFNQDMNYVRRKMRLHYANKQIIQPLDVVNIFISSKTKKDEKITQGFNIQSAGLSIGDKLNSLVRNINSALGDLSNPEKSDDNITSSDEIEKSIMVGPDFPTWLWKLYKNDFTKQSAGTAVFVGLVQTASHSYSDGRYTLTVSCEDNSGYFSKSQINVKPSLDVFNQSLYDPLTPFKVSFDAATGTAITDIQDGQTPELLDENKILLNSEAVKFTTGRFRGNPASEALHKTPNIEQFSGSGSRTILSNPDGFVYRWKQGIQSLTKYEQASPESSLQQESSPLLTKDPFAGQDVMNVLSLLVTGQPYNYNSFLRAALANLNDVLSRDPNKNVNKSASYIDALVDNLKKRNTQWGNFVPFKKLIINEEAESFIRSGQDSLLTQNSRILELQKRRAELQDQQKMRIIGMSRDNAVYSRDAKGQLQAPTDGSPVDAGLVSIQLELNKINAEINKLANAFQTQAENLLSNKPGGQIKIIGDDISLQDGVDGSGKEATSEEQRRATRDEFRRKLDFLTQRLLWKTKANEDINLFIVDDQYDKSWDIQGFERSIGNALQLFSSEFMSMDTQIPTVAMLLGLEIFADTQGNIRVRPPQYNMVPSSVFYQMFKTKAQTGVQVFPQFLESLYFNQIKGLLNQIEIDEDEIRLRATALGKIGDRAIAQFLRGSGSYGSEGFVFVSDESNGTIGDADIRKFIQQSRPDINEELVDNALSPLSDKLANAAKPSILFDAVARETLQTKLNTDRASSQEAKDRLYDIRQRLARNKNIAAPTDRELFSDDRFRRINEISQLDIFNLMTQITTFVSERQKLLISAVAAIKNISEGALLNESGKGATNTLFPQLNRNPKKSIPAILEHMIEDETNHSLGPGSGDRYVIRDVNIISLQIQEVPPLHTLVQVNGKVGLQGEGGIIGAPSDLTLSSNGGNVMTSAYAVDYDMWNMYGFRAPNSIEAPYFTNPDTQCAPFAVYVLNLARKNILQSTCVVAGNEYYQPGDVVYIEDRDLLFYVEDVQHAFSYSGTFQTTLTLKYGHNPGEYIPTMLDIVGKILYNSRTSLNQFRNSRFDNSNGDIPLGALIYDNYITGEDLPTWTGYGTSQIVNGSAGKQNQSILSHLLLALSGALNPTTSTTTKPKLQLRIYYSTNTTGVVDANLRSTAEDIKSWLQNPQTSSIMPGIKIISKNDQHSGSFGVSEDQVDIVLIDVNETTEHSPSIMAWDSVRTVMGNRSTPSVQVKIGELPHVQDMILYTNIIDVWLVFEDVVESTDTTAPGTNKTSEAQQNAQQATDDAFNNRASS